MTEFCIISALLHAALVATINGSPLQPKKCPDAINLDILNPSRINGQYEGVSWIIAFNAYLEKDTIYSTTTFHNASSEELFVVELSLPFTSDRQIPGMHCKCSC